MNDFERHQREPINHKVPSYFNHQLKWEERETTLFLDVNNKEVIQDFYYQTTNAFWVPYFSRLAEITRGLRLDQALSLKIGSLLDLGQREPVFPIPFLLFRSLLQDYKGNVSTRLKASLRISPNLICRCFGVDRETIEETIQNMTEVSVIGVTNTTRAGGGCTSCLDDITRIIKQNKIELGVGAFEGIKDAEGRIHHFNGKTPAEFILTLDRLIKRWIEDQSFKENLEIVELKGHSLAVKGQLTLIQLESLQLFLREEVGEPVFLFPRE